jgi:uncharacterized protein (TIGR02453 family)
MTSGDLFTGFPREGIQFLSDITMNNNREWFNANKTIFQESIQKPAQDFVIALGSRLQLISPGITFDTRLNGSGTIMRIYRDIRFSKDKTPYKTYTSMIFWEGPSKKASYSGYFIRINPSGARIHVGKHEFDAPLRTAYREAVVDPELGASLEKSIQKVEDAGDYEVGGTHYKRVPQGYDKDHARADLLRYKGLWASSPAIDASFLKSSELVDICFEHCQKIAPIHHWLVGLQATGGE